MHFSCKLAHSTPIDFNLMYKIDFNKKGTFDKIKQEVERYNKFSKVVFGKGNQDKEIKLKEG